MFTLQPVSTSVADLFYWETQVSLASNVVGATGNTAKANFQIANDRCFLLTAFMGSTNYDNVAGDFIASIGAGPAPARTLISPPFAPNNFTVEVKYNNRNYFFGSPMPQACLCSNGYRSGLQLPFPVILPAMSNFEFTFRNTARTLQLNGDDSARALEVSFGLYGYFVLNAGLEDFLAQFPAYQAQMSEPGWVKKFTRMEAFARLLA